MSRYLFAYLGTAVVMVALDMLWLGLIAKNIYQQGIGHLMLEAPQLPAAVSFYVLYALGIVVFAVAPQSDGISLGKTAVTAALFGFFAYATYDLTNLATLRGWPVGLALMDIAWGSCVSALSAIGGKLAMDWAAAR